VALPRGTADRFAAAIGQRGLQQKFPRILDAVQRVRLEELLKESL
jgi:hypothetical protein